MAEVIYRLSAQQSVTVRRSGTDTGGELLELEAVWSGEGSLPPAHLHPSQQERFEVVEGRVRVRIGADERLLGPGDVLDVPRETVHAMTAAGDGARAIWQIRPALRTEEFFAGLDAVQRRGGSLLDVLLVAREHTAEVRYTRPPRWAQGPIFAVAGLVARLRRR